MLPRAVTLFYGSLISTATAQTYYTPPTLIPAQPAGLSPAQPAVCPANAPVSCGNVGQVNWCCPANTVCQTVQPNQAYQNSIGCCPSGQNCYINPATTLTTTVYTTPAPAPAPATTVLVAAAPIPLTTTQITQVVQPQQTVVVIPAGVVGVQTQGQGQGGQGGYCSTLTARGPGLPTTAQGGCGTILVVNGGRRGKEGVRWGWVAGVGVGTAVLVGMGVLV